MPDRLRPSPRSWPLALARALLPSSCALCGAGCDGVVCAPCHAEHVAPRRPRCRCCANPLDAGGARCASCLAGSPAFDATVAAVDYALPLDQLVLQLKFGGRLALAPWFARIIAGVVREDRQFALPNVLCPVPLGPQRLAGRGFNQALEIARPLSKLLGIPLRPRLAIRALETPAQSGVAPAQRRANIHNAFIVAPDALAMVRGLHIGIVDDVMTSGHTLNELAATFKRFGAARVSNLVFARTPPH
ncbi:ComF family protein [Massilia cavernae]|uniref:ComF family protein n=1 Tax=Massilia cavernae TaxID=2320864 RepID=A0A418XT32_9BURK|nr:ComF family protein [Massilia cavernae]RJG15803.1 ComF family protein [Massilia cavernae]